MGWINVVKGQKRTARVYLGALRDDLIYRDAAEAMLESLDHGFPAAQATRIDELRSFMPEDGGTASFTVELNTQPESDVTINFATTDDTEGTVSPTTLTIAPGEWQTAQTVIVTGVDDVIIDGNQTTKRLFYVL